MPALGRPFAGEPAVEALEPRLAVIPADAVQRQGPWLGMGFPEPIRLVTARDGVQLLLHLRQPPPAPFTVRAVGRDSSGSARRVQTRSGDHRPCW